MQLVPLLRNRGPKQLAPLSLVSRAAEFVPSNPSSETVEFLYHQVFNARH
jgi:hypothetical protein